MYSNKEEIKDSGLYRTYMALLESNCPVHKVRDIILGNKNISEILNFYEIDSFEVLLEIDKTLRDKVIEVEDLYILLPGKYMLERVALLLEKDIGMSMDLLADLKQYVKNQKYDQLLKTEQEILSCIGHILLDGEREYPLEFYKSYFSVLDLISHPLKDKLKEDYCIVDNISKQDIYLDNFKKPHFSFADTNMYLLLNGSMRSTDISYTVSELEKRLMVTTKNQEVINFLLEKNKDFFEALTRNNEYEKKEQEAIKGLLHDKLGDDVFTNIFLSMSKSIGIEHRVDLSLLETLSPESCKKIDSSFFKSIDTGSLVKISPNLDVLESGLDKLMASGVQLDKEVLIENYINHRAQKILQKEYFTKDGVISTLDILMQEIKASAVNPQLDLMLGWDDKFYRDINLDEFKFIFYSALGLDNSNISKTHHFWKKYEALARDISSFDKSHIDIEKIKEILDCTYLKLAQHNTSMKTMYDRLALETTKDVMKEKLLLSLTMQERNEKPGVLKL